jgi:hypothetical protein
MKILISVLLFMTTSLSFAGQCPELAGSYHCMFSNDQYSLLKIEQKNLSEPETQELVEYSFDLVAIPGDPDVITASNSGEPDNMGWITKCSRNRLVSIPHDGSMISEIYLDAEKAFVRTLNGPVQQRCPRKL